MLQSNWAILIAVRLVHRRSSHVTTPTGLLQGRLSNTLDMSDNAIIGAKMMCIAAKELVC